jgi:transposase-like protein
MAKSKSSRASRWTPAQARLVIERIARSGVTVKQYADEHGLGVERLYRWKRRLQEARPGADAAARFAEVTIRPSPPAKAIEIELPGGVCLRVAGDSRVDDTVAILSRLAVR